MKVLQVIDSLAPGGAETIVSQLAPCLRSFGIDSSIYVLKQTKSRLEAACDANGVIVYRSPIRSLNSPRQVDGLRRHVGRHRYDLIHVHLFPAQLWGAVAARLGNWSIPLVTTEHSTTNRRRNVAFNPLDRWMYAQYTAVVGVSKGTSETLARWVARRSGRIRTINNGVDTESIAAVPALNVKRELGIDGKFLAISVGRCESPKNYECSIRAMAQVQDIHLAIVGDGVLLPSLRSLAESLGLAARVHFLGRRDDAIGLLKGADLYVQASRWEGFGIATAEAMAVGLPVIAADVPGLGDLVGEAALKFNPHDETQLANCIVALATDSDLRNRLAAQARTRSRGFELAVTAREYADLYRSLLQRK